MNRCRDTLKVIQTTIARESVKMRGLYRHSCPNCGGVISDERLLLGLPCEKCLPDVDKNNPPTLHDVFLKLVENKSIRDKRELSLAYIKRLNDMVNDFRAFFKKCVGSEPWSIQVTWAKRILSKSSFSMIAPTGVGKSTFGIVASIYLAAKMGFRTLIVVPTTVLAQQLAEKAYTFVQKLNLDTEIPIVSIHSRMPKSLREENQARLESGDFKIAILTSAFLTRNENVSKLARHKISFVFVDDVDAFMKGGKIFNNILNVLGLSDRDIRDALSLVDLRRRIAALLDFSSSKAADLIEQYNKKKQELEAKARDVILVVSSATGYTRGKKIKTLRELFGFEIGSRVEILRNIVDSYIYGENLDSIIEKSVSIIKRLGGGGLIYVPKDLGIEFAEKISKILKEKTGLSIEVFASKKPTTLKKYIEGEIDILVGVATFYGVMVRGIDLPERIRYSLFIYAPRHKIKLDINEELDLSDLMRLLSIYYDIVGKDEQPKIRLAMIKLRRILARYPSNMLEQTLERVRSGKIETQLEKDIKDIIDLANNLISKTELMEKLYEHPYIKIEKTEKGAYIYIPDWATYIQASGRTSRLYVGGITKGLSVILEEDKRILNGLERRLRFVIEDFKFHDFNDLDIDKILSEIDKDRERVKLVKMGRIDKLEFRREELTKTILMIVESPNKARTIANFFGKPSIKEIYGIRAYEVSLGNITLLITSSGGHVVDLIVDDEKDIYDIRSVYEYDKYIYGVLLSKRKLYLPIYTTIKKCLECGYQFTAEKIDDSKTEVVCPIKRIEDELISQKLIKEENRVHGKVPKIKDSITVLNALKRLALEVDEIYIATDPDTEGEKIGYDLKVVLKPYNSKIRRIEFHEVTRKAIAQAISNPRDFNDKLVEAQIVRRVEDRWLGFSLSERVTQYYCTDIKNDPTPLCLSRRLSAGRVQTPVLGWIIDRFNKYKETQENYLIIPIDNENYYRLEIPVRELREKIRPGDILNMKVKVIETRYETINPPPPYTTDTLLADASHILRLSAPKAMAIAQDLFESGLITYHRTDSTRVSDTGIGIARQYLEELLGEKHKEVFKPRKWGEGGAHEAIRPTRPIDSETLQRLIDEGIIEIGGRATRSHIALYDLIFRRFIASQSSQAEVVKSKLNIDLFKDGKHIASREIDMYTKVIIKGFTMFYPYSIKVIEIPSDTHETRISIDRWMIRKLSAYKLYTSGDIVKEMKSKGIGRPSTYAKIVDVLLQRGYVLQKGSAGYLIPTSKGITVYEFLDKNYGDLVSENRTRDLENRMDQIERGEISYIEVLDELIDELKNYNLIK